MSKKLRIMSVVGARPNFMKMGPFVRQLAQFPDTFDSFLVHTGQHYDAAMSDAFFRTLGIPDPDANLGIGSGTHAEQVGRTMMAFERVVQEWKPDWVVVPGDVNATCACALTAKKEHVRLAHIEAGLRSFDRAMPEEINRVIADRLADLLFTTDELADQNLVREGIPPDTIRRVGNIMIDTLEEQRPRAAALDIGAILERSRCPGLPARPPLPPGSPFALLTLHRPSNVDDPAALKALVGFFLDEAAGTMPLVWTIHPRTRRQMETAGLWPRVAACPALHLLEPLDYLDMLRLNMGARLMLTDSGGLQEECCVLGTPCITLRENTERPVTLRKHGGTCELAGHDIGRVRLLFESMRSLPRRESRPPLWDGHTAERIVEVFRRFA